MDSRTAQDRNTKDPRQLILTAEQLIRSFEEGGGEGSGPTPSQEEGKSVLVGLGVPDRLGRPAGAPAEWAAGT